MIDLHIHMVSRVPKRFSETRNHVEEGFMLPPLSCLYVAAERVADGSV